MLSAPAIAITVVGILKVWERLLKVQIPGPHPGDSGSVDAGCGTGICLVKSLLGCF